MDVDGRVLIKASNTINVPYDKVVSFFADPLSLKKINDNIKKAEVLYNKNDFVVVHVEISMPGPISDRTTVTLHTVKN
jgi:hypothetical protein